MPHIHNEFSTNPEEVVDIAVLCEAVRPVAAKIDACPTPGIRVHATGSTALSAVMRNIDARFRPNTETSVTLWRTAHERARRQHRQT